MTPAQPLLPFFPSFAALERAAKPGGVGRGELELAATHPYAVAADASAADAADDDDERATVARPDRRLPRAPQLPRPQLFSRARGSSPDLLGRRR